MSRMLSTRSLTGRLVVIALIQTCAVVLLAIVVAWFTLPDHREDHRPDHGPPERGRAHHGPPEGHGPPDAHGPPHHERDDAHRSRRIGPLITLILTLLVLLLGGYLTARWLIAPLRALQQATRAFGDGALDTRTGLAREDEIGELASAFDDMAARVEGIVAAERMMLANISHELRTPLARIRVAVELVEEGEEALAREALGEIVEDLAEMEGLIDDILSAARLEGVIDPAEQVIASARARIAPETLVASAASRFRARYPARPLEVDVPAAPLPELSVHVMLCRRALENLLENAHKYAQPPGSPVALRASYDATTGRVRFEVQDHGQGIPEADQRRLFEPFFRGEGAAREAGGLGLGLGLVRRIVLAHGGEVSVHSAPGEGTTARVELPAG